MSNALSRSELQYGAGTGVEAGRVTLTDQLWGSQQFEHTVVVPVRGAIFSQTSYNVESGEFSQTFGPAVRFFDAGKFSVDAYLELR